METERFWNKSLVCLIHVAQWHSKPCQSDVVVSVWGESWLQGNPLSKWLMESGTKKGSCLWLCRYTPCWRLWESRREHVCVFVCVSVSLSYIWSCIITVSSVSWQFRGTLTMAATHTYIKKYAPIQQRCHTALQWIKNERWFVKCSCSIWLYCRIYTCTILS